jgi:predicted MFS family arabinose efflux permease
VNDVGANFPVDMAWNPQHRGDRPSPKRSRLVDNLCIAAYCWSFLVFGLQVALLGPTSSEVAQSLGVLEADLGVVYTVNGFISIIGAIPSGWAIDKLPGHVVLAMSLALEVGGGGRGGGK